MSLCLLALLALTARAGALELEGNLTQGGFARGIAAPGSTVTLDETPVPVLPDGRFAIAFGRDSGPSAVLAVTTPDGTRDVSALTISPRTFDIQRVEGVPQKYVEPPPEALAHIAIDKRKKTDARSTMYYEAMFWDGFDWPAVGPISGVYGSQRFYNGEPRNPHWGVDIAAPRGTPVKAPADGIVTLADPGMYFEGGLIFIDHGLGVVSALLHLDGVDVTAGTRVKKGEVVGRLGGSGRATGPHLDWRISWQGRHFDPQLLVPPMPATGQ